MAAKFPQGTWVPPRSSARTNRMIRPSQRIREQMFPQVKQLYTDALTRIEGCNDFLQDLMSVECDIDVFKNALLSWQSLSKELHEAEVELRRHLEDRQLETYDQKFADINFAHEQIRKMAFEYMQNLTLNMEEELRSPYREDQDDSKDIDGHLHRLQSRVKALDKDLLNYDARLSGRDSKITNVKEIPETGFHVPTATSTPYQGTEQVDLYPSQAPFTVPCSDGRYMNQAHFPYSFTESSREKKKYDGLPPEYGEEYGQEYTPRSDNHTQPPGYDNVYIARRQAEQYHGVPICPAPPSYQASLERRGVYVPESPVLAPPVQFQQQPVARTRVTNMQVAAGGDGGGYHGGNGAMEMHQISQPSRRVRRLAKPQPPSQPPDPDPDPEPSDDGDGESSSCSSRSSNSDNFAKVLVKELRKIQRQDKLPRIEPEVFSGDPLQFPRWYNSMKILVEGEIEDKTERLFYLEKYTSGRAQKAISKTLDLYWDPEAYDECIKKLKERFGSKSKIAEAFRAKISAWPVMKKTDVSLLQNFSDLLWQCHSAMKTMHHLRIMAEPDENTRLAKKLPVPVADRWNREVVKHQRMADEPDSTLEPYPSFTAFCEFVEREAQIADGPCSSAKGDKNTSTPAPSSAKTKTVLTAESTVPDEKSKKNGNGRQPRGRASNNDNVSKKCICYYCKKEHGIDKCSEFLSLAPGVKKEFARTNNLCYGCLNKSHGYSECTKKNKSLLKSSNVEGRQSSSSNEVISHDLNVTVKPDNGKSEVDNEQSSSISKESIPTASVVSHATCFSSPNNKTTPYTLVLPVYLSSTANPDVKIRTYAILDSQSDGCFVTEDVQEALQLDGDPVDLDVRTLTYTSTSTSLSITDLMVQGVDCEKRYSIEECFSCNDIPFNRDSIPDPKLVKAWPHLSSVADKLHAPDPSMKVGLLIGYVQSEFFVPENIARNSLYDPYAVETIVGWGVMGGRSRSRDSSTSRVCNITKVHRSLEKDMKRVFDSEFGGPDTDVKRSYEDKMFMDLMDREWRMDENGRMVLPLPVREGVVSFPESKAYALKRLMSLRVQLKRDPVYRQRYADFIQAMLDAGHLELVYDEGTEGWVWYLPHFGVYHPRKPDKLRVVFAANTEIEGVSLNESLMQGPDLCNNLQGVLCRFREEKEPFKCDIKGMFHQVMVEEKFRDLQRLLWFENGDPDGKVLMYRIKVHFFGAKSSPSCATYALRKVANEYEGKFGFDAAQFVRRNFYVDDGLKSMATTEKALQLIGSARNLCSEGGFELLQFSSSSKQIMAALPSEIRAKELQTWMPGNELPDQFALGSLWSLYHDAFIYLFQLMKVNKTRRGLLSALSSLYDPLGFIAPVVLVGKQILQSLCKDKITWDQEVPESIVRRWDDWYNELHQLERLRIPRCFKKSITDVEKTELHVFGDASEDGHGACSYLVLEDPIGTRDVSLLMGKTRVPPLKSVTMPRRELQAAVLSVKMASFLKEELDYDNIIVFFWVDSMIVLAYIVNGETRFKIYVANRVEFIRGLTSVEQWNFVSGDINPADLASRGVSPATLVDSRLWFQGPDFLQNPIIRSTLETPDIDANDPEIRKPKEVHIHSLSTQRSLDVLSCFDRISSWRRAVLIVLIWRSYFQKCRAKARSKKGILVFTCAEPPGMKAQRERVKAKSALAQLVQKAAFPNEFEILQGFSYPTDRSQCHERKKNIPKDSKISDLDPFFCKELGLIRVGGRVKRGDLPMEIKHPILLPKNGHMVDLLLRHFHQSAAHADRATVAALIRAEGWWVQHIRAALSRIRSQCVDCKKLRGKPLQQIMADLPQHRLDPCPPFTHCGVDFFGPFLIQDKRVTRKRWACLFCCLVVRCIHIEICDAMTTDAFLQAYRRFVARRGPIATLRCDRGSNLMGARGQLDKDYAKLDQKRIKEFLSSTECDWIEMIPNAPKASHMGGIWERLIGSVRRVLEALLLAYGTQLDDSSLRTLMCESEVTVNNRPLTYVDLSSPETPLALTPSILLTMKRKGTPPPFGSFPKEDLYAKYMWRRVQFIAEQFWRQWKSEYIPILQSRKKWTSVHPNVEKDDIVLLIEDNLPRSAWPLGRIMDVKMSQDNLVRSLTVKTQFGLYDRPIKKVILLYRPPKAES